MGRHDFDDLQGVRGYRGRRAHNQSKLASVMFTYELARRLAGTKLSSQRRHRSCLGGGRARSGGAP